nr:hypothetical protein [Xanthomonadales bacterium]NIT32663.1 hypothetical protein [Xanthomonadales bacterium]
LIHGWVNARETALARVRSVPGAQAQEVARFRHLTARARQNALGWKSAHPLQIEKVEALRADMARFEAHLETGVLDHPKPWDALYRWAEADLSLEGQEQVVSLMLEPYPGLVDDLADTMAADEAAAFPIDGTMSVATLREILERVMGGRSASISRSTPRKPGSGMSRRRSWSRGSASVSRNRWRLMSSLWPRGGTRRRSAATWAERTRTSDWASS